MLCLAAAVIMAIIARSWAPPFHYREGYTPSRDIIARTEFTVPDPVAVDRAQEAARRQARHAYLNAPQPLKQLRASLRTKVADLLEAEKPDEAALSIWQEFVPQPTSEDGVSDEDRQQQAKALHAGFEYFRFALAGERRLQFDGAVERAVAELEEHGLFEKRDESNRQYPGNPLEIFVFRENEWDSRQTAEVREVQITFVKPTLQENLKREMEPLQQEVKEQLRREARQVYVHDPQPLIDLRTRLQQRVESLTQAQQFDEDTAKLWREFLARETPETPLPDETEQKRLYDQFQSALAELEGNETLADGIATVMEEVERRGLLADLKSDDEAPEGNQKEIIVLSAEDASQRQIVPVEEVRLAEVKPVLREKLEKQLKSLEVAGRIFTWLERQLPAAVTLRYRPAGPGEAAETRPALNELVYHWLESRLPTTLSLDPDRTAQIQAEAAAAVDPEQHATRYTPGNSVLATAGKPLDEAGIERLWLEHKKLVAEQSPLRMLQRSLAVLGMYVALYTLCGLFIYFRYPGLLSDTRRFLGLLILAVVTVAAGCVLAHWKAELIPLLLFGMTVAIVYRQELALLLSAGVALVVVLSLGHDLQSFVTLTAAAATAVLMLRRIRSRVKLVYVGACAGAVALLTTIGVNSVSGRSLDYALLQDAGLYGLWGIAAGFIMTGLLPFIEHIFGVLTEISLLELGDVAHPLLQELVRRAPGTYNHSITVASIAEAAAECIGAQGLLARVGAYFHDIGKMLKPQYFVENQTDDGNRHESLVPAMSTLIIIAHVKDGADLARQHRLSQPIIDFIQQHHGTTLVEYFYRRASEDRENDPDAADVDENAFRYPGPKPQTKETGILMLADAVESASRVLVEPTPSRIESLVEEIAMKRLLEGQLDESGLTLSEVRAVQESLVKSLTAVYHGRVKYPDQKTA
jgi:putative nucleotidyltransferase with HDIG domain